MDVLSCVNHLSLQRVGVVTIKWLMAAAGARTDKTDTITGLGVQRWQLLEFLSPLFLIK